MTSEHPYVRRYLLYAAFAVLLLAMIVSIASSIFDAGQPELLDEGSGQPIAPLPPQSQVDVPAPTDSHEIEKSATELSGVGETENTATSTGGESNKPRLFKVICETIDGRPIQDVKVGWMLLERRADRQHELKIVEKESCVTNGAGEAVFEFQQGDVAHVEVSEKGWYAKPIDALLADTSTATLVLLRSAIVRISATYDDGQPVTYAGSLNSKVSYGYNGTFALNESGFAEIAGVGIELPLECTIFAGQRLGYSSHRVTFTSAELESGNELLVIVPKREENLGKFKVYFGEQVSRIETSVIIEQQDGTPHSAGRLSATADSWESDKLPAGHHYRLIVTGPRAWRSDWIEAVAGEVVAVHADLQQCATVRIRLLDSDGLPIEGGVLRVSDGAYLIYNKGRPPSPYAHPDRLSAKDGTVELTGLPSGVITIEAEAWGKQPVARDVNLRSGSYVELGDWTLPSASGTLEVQVVGKREGESYAVFVGGKDGSPIRPFIPFADDRCVVEHLAYRTYTIGVTLAAGGTVVYETVHLSEDSPNQTVLLDVQSIQSNRPPRK
ncbi:MAG: hypothetical protein K8I27_17425 [Planctomycetes bacterium]|nr:hypothetical protein [Planctomycetota bacterium]